MKHQRLASGSPWFPWVLLCLNAMMLLVVSCGNGDSVASLAATPTLTPTPMPTSTVTAAASATPTPAPTSTPTLIPTLTLSPMPSRTPTLTPTRPPTATTTPFFSEVTLSLKDLPKGFQQLTADEMEQMGFTEDKLTQVFRLSEARPINLAVFVSADSEHFAIVQQFLLSPLSTLEGVGMDLILSVPESQCPSMSGGMAPSDNAQQNQTCTVIPSKATFGDKSVGVSYVLSGAGGIAFRTDSLMVRRGWVLEGVSVSYVDGKQPPMSAVELTRILDGRVGAAVAQRPVRPTALPTLIVAFKCDDRLGCIDIGPNDPIHIGYLFAMSGEGKSMGLDSRYGAELAIEDAGGKVLGHAIKFDGLDSGCSAEGGKAAASKLATDKTIVAVIGPTCSSEARSAIPILIGQSGLSMISASSTAPDLTDPANHVAGYFRTVHNDRAQGAVAADFAAKQLKLTRGATIHEGGPFSQDLAGAFADQFRKNGGTITSQERVNSNDQDMRPVLARIAVDKPDVIYFPVFAPAAGRICSQIREVPGLEKTVMISSEFTFSIDFMRACGKNAVGMFWSSPNYEAFGSDYEALVNKYMTKYNAEGRPSPFHAYSYDAMNMLLLALQKPNVVVKDAKGTLHVQKQALRDAIAATKDLKGVTGNLTCNRNGDCADPKISIYLADQSNLASLTLPGRPVWSPGGPDYQFAR